jgi:hypothetical protein
MQKIRILQLLLGIHIIIALIHSYLHFQLGISPRLVDWIIAVPTSVIFPIIILILLRSYYSESVNSVLIVSITGFLHGTISHLILDSADHISHQQGNLTTTAFSITVYLLLITQLLNLGISYHLRRTNDSK